MRVLLIGSGGREHALLWALRQSPEVEEVLAATTNAGIRRDSTAAQLESQDPQEIAAYAVREKIDLVVVGPEQPLVDGLVDQLAAEL